jgi:hypothetical protein
MNSWLQKTFCDLFEFCNEPLQELCYPRIWYSENSYGGSPYYEPLSAAWKDEASLKFLPHDEHLYGFLPVWILVWNVRDDLVPKDFSHKEQLNGFSPIWILHDSWEMMNI